MPAESSPLKVKIQDNVKAAMRAKEKERLATLRQITAAI
ncbi:MAG: GatB/YqeY domain-containing protein, partial [Gammaproteobacteria bacterium]